MTDPNPQATDPAQPRPVVDTQQPWLGLASFSEETRQYFHGREEEVGELSRRVQRKLLTVLFGKSGLGKTSILRAGVVPRLRDQGYCPVYVRIDYSPGSPTPSEQIKQAIYRTASQAGQWTQQGVAAPEESPWEFLHHRDDMLHDAAGNPLIPLLVFDQFEEVFTLGQTDDAGRQRAQRFLQDLADLVENRPPKEVEARLEHDDSWAERFDFARSDYRVLIALREDYLAHLEGLKAQMPSVTQNRMRLAPMTGEQALMAVSGPGGHLVTREVAEAIVRFVAGGAELRNAEVEPSLLSLICRELNDARIAAGRREISLDLLEGSRASILTNFYERALADQPAAVRQIIEDQLLTESGYRENVAEERLLGELTAAGAPGALPLLVDRRLLRIEERLDVRRVELTHDVLCEVVRASRDLRKERDARASTEAQLAEQRERARAARRALYRARQVAVVCVLLAVGAIGASIFAYRSSQRAHEAELHAQQVSAQAELARGQAERLIAYLMEDFARELEPVGQKIVISDLDKRVVDYYSALPASLKTAETERNRALAQVSFARALYRQSRTMESQGQLSEAIPVLEKLYAAGDHSDATTIGLAESLAVQADVKSSSTTSGEMMELVQRAVHLLEPVADRTEDVSVPARLAIGGVTLALAYYKYDDGLDAEAEALDARAMAYLASIGAKDLSNRPAAAQFVRAAGWRVHALAAMEKFPEARAIGKEGLKVADMLLDQQPGNLLALYARDLIYAGLGGVAGFDGHLSEAVGLVERGEKDLMLLTRLDPSFQTGWNNLGAARGEKATLLFNLGRRRQSAQTELSAIDAIRGSQRNNAFSLRNEVVEGGLAAIIDTDLTDSAAAEHAFAIAEQAREASRHDAANHGAVPPDIECWMNATHAEAAVLEGRAEAALGPARALASASDERLRNHDPSVFANYCRYFGWYEVGNAEFALGHFDAAQAALQTALDVKFHSRGSASEDERRRSNASIFLALSQARLGKTADALHTITPVVAFTRARHQHSAEDMEMQRLLGCALYAQAMADAQQRAALLQEASALLAGLPAEMRGLRSVTRWRARVAHALDPSGTPDPDRVAAAS